MVRNKSLEIQLRAYGSMSLALAAVALPSAARAGSFTYTADLTTSNGADSAIYFDPADGYSGFVVEPANGSVDNGPNNFELLMSVTSSGGPFVTDRLEVGPSAHKNGNNFVVPGSVSSIARLNASASIGPLLKFSSANGTLAGNSYSARGNWLPAPSSGVIGLQMPAGPSSYLYGWADITVNPDYTITLNSFGAADAPDEDVVADPTPEPASIVLLALGAAGIAAWRRKTASAR